MKILRRQRFKIQSSSLLKPAIHLISDFRRRFCLHWLQLGLFFELLDLSRFLGSGSFFRCRFRRFSCRRFRRFFCCGFSRLFCCEFSRLFCCEFSRLFCCGFSRLFCCELNRVVCCSFFRSWGVFFGRLSCFESSLWPPWKAWGGVCLRVGGPCKPLIRETKVACKKTVLWYISEKLNETPALDDLLPKLVKKFEDTLSKHVLGFCTCPGILGGYHWRWYWLKRTRIHMKIWLSDPSN